MQRQSKFRLIIKHCRLCQQSMETVDYKDIQTLQRFCTQHGKIISRKRSGACAKHQRMITSAIKYARFMALLPYVS